MINLNRILENESEHYLRNYNDDVGEIESEMGDAIVAFHRSVYGRMNEEGRHEMFAYLILNKLNQIATVLSAIETQLEIGTVDLCKAIAKGEVPDCGT